MLLRLRLILRGCNLLLEGDDDGLPRLGVLLHNIVKMELVQEAQIGIGPRADRRRAPDILQEAGLTKVSAPFKDVDDLSSTGEDFTLPKSDKIHVKPTLPLTDNKVARKVDLGLEHLD